MPKMPPLNPLHVFHVAARSGSFSRAAQEMGVTQSAVSRQVSTLEEYLGTKLFLRESRGIELTQDGRDYAERIGPAMDNIATATDLLLARNRSTAVRVAAYPTFAGKWLIPRLKAFGEVHRNTQIKIKTCISPVDPETSAFDVAIQLRPMSEVDPEFSLLLYRDILQPFCSPAYLRQQRLTSPKDLLSVPLLTSHYRRLDWHHWFEGAGLPSQSIEGDEFPSSILTYRAAQEGLGVAIGQPFLVAEEIAAGQLVPIFQPIERDLGLFVIWTRYANARVRGFIKWLAAEVERTDDARPANVTEPFIEKA